MVNMVFHQQSSGETDEFFEIEEAYAQGEALVRAGGWITKDAGTCIHPVVSQVAGDQRVSYG